ncbi:hypothetical protein [Pseudomonas typographi]|uniref:Lipoprotein n=1 Tax=Pseudomonas typographi TaxID=2715964 RepID=A0ABR7Z965_9PSED|nr:hypothetical protein [Pseudomonas typographi]MBD1601994.1 hypothetical protein [Pseudomonas typographi]
MKKAFLICANALLLTACVSDQATTEELSRYNGKTLDEFVIANGAPRNSYALKDGNTIYYWSSAKSVYMPGGSTTTFSGSQAYTQTYDGGNIKTECQLDILVNQGGEILSVTMRKNTIGYWTSSACHEYVK